MKVNEVLLENKNNAFIKQHIQWLADQLDIKKLPKITLLNDPVDTTFGQYDPDTKSIKLVTGGRHPVDVLRTLAHELTHYKQDIENNLPDGAGETGTDQENEANANAGIVMRDFAQENPDQFGLDNGVAEGSEQISEYRDRLLQYVKSLLPNYPEYVLKDWLVPNKGDFSNLPDTDLKNGIMEKLKLAGLTLNTKWQLVPNMKFTMGMFEPMSKQRLIGRAGGNSDMGLDVPRDKERHATQAALAQQQGGVRKEPVLLIKTDKGYELLEGWHRTIQHFVKYPDGYTGPAYVAVAQQGVAEASYPGNIGMMEVAKFFNIAKPEEKIKFKRLMNMGKKDIAWQLIQQVTGVKLQGKEFDLVTEHIVKHGSQFRLLSKKGKNLGTFPSHKAAAKHEGEVEYFKAHPKK